LQALKVKDASFVLLVVQFRSRSFEVIDFATDFKLCSPTFRDSCKKPMDAKKLKQNKQVAYTYFGEMHRALYLR